MKIKTTKEPLLKTAQILQNVISNKTTLPVLANFLMETQKDKIYLAATDLDMGISFNLPVEILEEGSITIPAKKFSDIVRDIPEGDIQITIKKNNSISIESQRCFFRLMGLPKEEFPKLPRLLDRERIVLTQHVLKNMLSLTSFAVSSDETRYTLTGVLFVVKDNKLRLVATDGRRLALMEKALDIPCGFSKEAIVPLKAIQELARNLKDTGDVTIIFGKNQISFQFEDITIISRLIEGQFPDYEKVIPKEESKYKININRERFLWAVKRVALLTSPNSQSIKLDLFKDKLVFSKNCAETGEAREELDIEYQGAEFSIGFNPQYLIDVLKSIPHQTVGFELTVPESPGVIRTEDNYIYIVLPMQFS
ncbi:MAG: DNA polymerase III subunit beta [Candidatus Omnitrophota bacterium]